VFVREATGLVREAGLFDVFSFNYAWTGASFGLWLAFEMGQVMWAFPGGDFGWANIIAIVPAILFFIVVYSMLSIVMPRSGGDYVYMSRLIYPSIGFAMSFTIAMMLAYYVGFGAIWAAGLAVATFLGTMGYYTGNQGLIAASTALQSTNTLAFALAPTIVSIPPVMNTAQGTLVSVNCDPQVFPQQSVSLALDSTAVPAVIFDNSTPTPVFQFPTLAPGSYVARLLVDGVESASFNATI
jgi:amino acid transporter